MFWCLVCCIDLILHIMIVLNVFQRLATLPGHEGSFKNYKNAVLNDPKCQKKSFLAIFRSLVCWIDLILHIVIELNVFQHLATSPGRERPFKNHTNPFLNDPKCKKRGQQIRKLANQQIGKSENQKIRNQKSENQKIRKSENQKIRKSENQLI